ncbi:saccharopine dehydrogenase NADP-binding domain-containing protein [Paenibacillus thiaminolyticus]|nr:saccharopine dehydrogenase NADP-binding domain-containing protein [Paenibacillus thiaminolyticus]MCY9538013.1 saccharopine dehydrogenase NADP-binding domain-containing protein [Paenibacillus thiaminolyticus]MCY9604921.1 saccharopine dehydrogenase NADP-binding domain-containing protein [Paenibacillus thiaminolyticus]MCY9610656.1 saccharopine dehydrogenase NADP-binding domain-containing protein [Paenibacillus thiaminolyticus]MCY9615984.1 saccharopine dehydrogenase NADP-binding domain-containin
MHTKEKIVVVGGCGHVGRTICGIMGECYPGKVNAAGRSRERTERFCQSAGGKIRPLEIDIREPLPPDILNGVKLGIMCLDRIDTDLVRACFRTGTHYIDVSANGSFLRQVEQFQHGAAAHGEALSFTDGQTFDFGRSQACRFPFSGQMTLPRTLEVPSAATRLCLDSAMVTGLLAGASRTGAVRLLQPGRLRRRIVRSLGALRFGGHRFAVKAEAQGRSRDGKLTLTECFLHGRDQSAATAKVAAASAAMLVNSFCPSGVYHIEQLTGMGSMLKELGPDITCYIRRSDLPPEGREAC